MPRKKSTAKVEDMTKMADKKAIAKAAKNADKLTQHLITIDTKYGDGLPYEQGRLINEVRFYLNHSAEAMLQAGRHLVVLKEHEPHGGFTKALEDIGLAPRAAQQMMQAAVKFTGSNAKALAHLGKVKMLELMIEDDEDLKELASGGTLAGLDLDEIDAMSTRELKAALRKSRKTHEADNTANEKLIEGKDKKLNKLSKRAKNWDSRVKEFNQETTNIASDVLEALSKLEALREVYLSEDFGDDNREQADNAMGCVYFNAIEQIGHKAAEVITACDHLFGHYANHSMTMVDYWEEKLDQE
ncbi:MAG: DUF3102 domain-containing protein [Thiotrichaceae bacterium]|nr:MAG: DUF3102 domain-containing protein [Thiotrichaceae bacterium]